MDDHGRFGLKSGAKADIAGGLKRVKLRRTQYEQMSSAVAPTTDIVGRVDELTATVGFRIAEPRGRCIYFGFTRVRRSSLTGQGLATNHYLRKPSLYPAELQDRSPAGGRGRLKAPYQSAVMIASLRTIPI